jgi:large-conductance mechanosensitive channel
MAGVAHIPEPQDAQVVASPAPLDDPSLYLDREISLLAFQHRVLEEARDPGNPLLERVKFLSILFSNLDEFFMVRVAILKRKGDSGLPDSSGGEQMERIGTAVRSLLAEAYAAWRDLELALAQAGIGLRDYSDLTDRERAALDTYFRQVVYPILTPLASDTGRTPMIVSEEMVSNMRTGSVIIDVSIDRGGCFETSEITSHEHPVFIKYGVIHYCVPNIPSGFARTASQAISNVITPLVNAAGDGGAAGKGLGWTINGQRINLGAVISAIIYFIIFMAVIYFLIVVPYRAYMQRRGAIVFGEPPPTRTCPECKSDDLPADATKCKYCASQLPAAR